MKALLVVAFILTSLIPAKADDNNEYNSAATCTAFYAIMYLEISERNRPEENAAKEFAGGGFLMSRLLASKYKEEDKVKEDVSEIGSRMKKSSIQEIEKTYANLCRSFLDKYDTKTK